MHLPINVILHKFYRILNSTHYLEAIISEGHFLNFWKHHLGKKLDFVI